MLFFVKAPCVICFIILFFSMVKFIIIRVKTFLLASFYQCLTNYPPPKALLRPSYGACVCVNLLYSAFVYILEKMKIR